MGLSAYNTVASAVEERDQVTSGRALFMDLAFPNVLLLTGLLLVAASAGLSAKRQKLFRLDHEAPAPRSDVNEAPTK